MAAAVNPKQSLALLEQKLAETANDRHRVVLNAVLKHARLEAESVWDVEQIMATLSPNPEYHIWFDGVDVGPKGADAVRAFYGGTISARTNFLEMTLERVVVDDNCAIVEGFLKQIYPGAVAAAMGMAVDDPDADYLLVYRALTLIPVDEDGLMLGEDTYTSGPASVIKLSLDELPQEYINVTRASG